MLSVFFSGRGVFAPYSCTSLNTSPAGADAEPSPPKSPPSTPLKPIDAKSAKLKSTAQGVMSVSPTCGKINHRSPRVSKRK